jgi:hypothetical protein
MDALNTPPLAAAEWLRLLEAEYLGEFIPSGGAAVKVVVAPDEALPGIAAALDEAASRRGMLTLRVDAAFTRVHMLQDVFFAIAAELDWDALLQRFVESGLAEKGYAWPRPGVALSMAELAETFDVAETLLARSRDEWLTKAIWQDRQLARDFRSAIVQLSLAHLQRDETGDSRFATVRQWLRGEKVPVGQLRACDIGGRINRTTARAMLTSLCHWLRKIGVPGLLVVLDLRRALRPDARSGEGPRYSPAAVMDTYEVLREMIDDTEHLPGLLLVVLAGDEMIAGDPKRSVEQYAALKMRIWPDVRPREQQNPLAPLVRLAA